MIHLEMASPYEFTCESVRAAEENDGRLEVVSRLLERKCYISS